jgi:hypothetical protein
MKTPMSMICRLCMVALWLLAGCGRGSDIPRAIISGEVSYQGHPIARGAIRFVPVKGTQGPQAGAEIKDGAYLVNASGGVPLGTHRVEIQAFREKAAKRNLPAPLREHGGGWQQYLPPQYNLQSQLEVTLDETGGRTRDFELK